jgi:hypothetical protein
MSVWIYDELGGPYQKKQYKDLLRLTKNSKMAEKGSKMLDMYRFLKSRSFEDSNQLRESVFFDKARKTHLLTKANADITFNSLFKKGGGEGALDHIIIRWMNFVKSLMPSVLVDTIQPGIDMINLLSLK